MTVNTFGALQILIQHAKNDELKSFFPDHFFKEVPLPEDVSLKTLSFSMQWLSMVHPSWIRVALQTFPLEVQSQMLAWLPSYLAQEISAQLPGVPISQNRCSSFGAFYLLNLLAQKIRPPGIVEEFFLSGSQFYPLLCFSGPTKMMLINCLGLYALAKELKNVVDKKIIERVHAVLSPTENLFLSYCQSHPMKYLDTTDFLSSWDQDAELHQFIHRQGLGFLAKALAKEDVSFLWYFLRRLDIGRGYIVEQVLRKIDDHSHVEYFKTRLEQNIQLLVK